MGEGRVGLIAGGGALPREAAACLAREGLETRIVGFEGVTDPAFVSAEACLRLGQVEALVERMRGEDVASLLIVGRFDPTWAEAPSPRFAPDETARRLFAEAGPEGPVAWMARLAAFLEREGLPLARQDVLLAALLARPGALSRAEPTAAQQADLVAGRAALAVQESAVLGQAVAVHAGHVVARETLEGTDALIRRAGAAAGAGFTLVKAARPGQDPRLDLPAIGPTTIDVLAEAGAGALAIEAGATL
ncbi:MAG: UDP-2,3-diacylglucosamine diphosphatase LpxI, partial [Myxococcota bacterium]